MVDFIQKEFRNIILKCCKKYEKDVVLVLGLDESGQNTYNILEYDYDYEKDVLKGYKWESAKSLSINEVLGVKIDFLGYGDLSQPFIQKAILRFSENQHIPYHKICIYCFPTTSEENKPDVDIFLYDGKQNESKYLETITFSDLFSEQDIMA
jgi:hypothetical protein